MYTQRIEKVLAKLEEMGLSQMIVSDPQAIWYLTGIMVSPNERIYVLYLNKNGKHTLVLNKLFHITPTDLPQIWLSDTDDAIGTLADLVCGTEVLGIDKDWTARFLLPLMERVEGLQCKVSSLAVDKVRAVKDENELALMRQASIVNDRVMDRAMAHIKEGLSEKDVANYIKEQYFLEGCDTVSFPPIVAFGDHASNPHHKTGDRVIAAGDCVLIDMGCMYQGYCSDMTRTQFFQSMTPHQKEIHDIVLQANCRAIASVRPGMRFCDIDAVARDYITQHGYGQQFTHRLGHSIGSKGHEYGDVSALNTDYVEVGNVFSIEPGIYLVGDMGVRVEDLVIVTADGCENLNAYDKNGKICGA